MMKDGQMDRREFWQGAQDMFAEREHYVGKGWRGKGGKLNNKGKDAFYNFIAGAAFGAGRAEDPLLFLMMVRGPEELARFLEKKD